LFTETRKSYRAGKRTAGQEGERSGGTSPKGVGGKKEKEDKSPRKCEGIIYENAERGAKGALPPKVRTVSPSTEKKEGKCPRTVSDMEERVQKGKWGERTTYSQSPGKSNGNARKKRVQGRTRRKDGRAVGGIY